MVQLADYTCHKNVKAGKITRLPILKQDDQARSTNRYDVNVLDEDGVPQTIEVEGSVFARSFPAVGDYIVFYEDGYVSWSPSGAFEDGYTRKQAADA